MELKTQKDIDNFFNHHQQKGLDELQKLFDAGGKLDFSVTISIDEVEEIIKNTMAEKCKKKLIFKDGAFEWS